MSHRMRTLPFLVITLSLCWSLGAAAKKSSHVPPPKKVNISAFKDKLLVFEDGRGHYLALMLGHRGEDHVFYGDGKSFYKQRVWGAGRNVGKKSFQYSIGDPRMPSGYQSSFRYRDGKATYQCEQRKTELTQLTPDKARAMLDSATFFGVYWVRVPHVLARDDFGVYYYVDRLAADPGEPRRGFRVFRGKLGKLKRLRMKNVVSDVKGEIFATPRGALRLVVDNGIHSEKGARWISGRKRRELTIVPVGHPMTSRMIYLDLGVYFGQPLHRPCDDL